MLDRDGAAAVDSEETEGYPPLREHIAEYVASLGIRTHPDEILITGGAQQALDLVVQALLSEGDTLVTSNPTYLGMLDIAHVRRVIPVGVPVDEDGMRLDELEAIIQARRPGLIYVAPTFHNPTGTVMPIHRRRQLLALAKRYNVPILEDAVYHELGYHGAAPPPLKALDEDRIVLHASGFSKILLPGTRTGYLIAAVRCDRLVRSSRRRRCAPWPQPARMHVYLASGALAVISKGCARLRQRCRRRAGGSAVFAARVGVDPHRAAGCTCGAPTDKADRRRTLSDSDPAWRVVRGRDAVSHGWWRHRYLRLNFSAQPPAKIIEGIKRLGAAWHAWCEAYDTPDAKARPFSSRPVGAARGFHADGRGAGFPRGAEARQA